ncbi:MAG: M20/M25/M40 family metallo-hydrolase [Anaerolineaceae bacterium]|nr:M20/M25/M40 family metallo-hydrolase [Anaerolineaceae bacterium]
MYNTKIKKEIYKDIDDHFSRYIEEARELVRQPSIAAQNIGIHECAEMVVEHIQRLGSTDVRLVEYPTGSPVVYGTVKSKNPRAKTLIIYCLYDVQPPEPLEEWKVEPFAAEIVDLPEFGPSIVGRGITNSKGPLVGTFKAIESMQRILGDVPLNFVFVIEGEEEAGSVNLKQFVHEYAGELSTADGVYLPGTREDENFKPKVLLGNKGMVYFELEVKGGAWGGPQSIDIHSMNGAWIENPIWRLAWALNTMRSPDGKILVEGFYDDVAPISETDNRLIERLMKTFDAGMFKKALDVSRFKNDLEGEDLLKQFLYSPTMNIPGIYGGYTGEGTKTIIPYRVRVKFDCRLVPNMQPDDIMQKIMTHLKKHGFDDISIVFSEGTLWSKTDAENDLAKAAIRAMESSGKEPNEVWPLLPGTGPAYLFTNDPLQMPFIAYGLGHGAKIHAPNEYLVVEGLRDNIKSVAATFLEYLEIQHENNQL